MNPNHLLHKIHVNEKTLPFQLSEPLLELLNQSQPPRSRGRPRAFNAKGELLVKSLLDAGCSVAAIAKSYGVCLKRVYRLRDRLQAQEVAA